jgi:hypothetical protein
VSSCLASGVQNDDDRKRLLHVLTLILPKSHRDTLEVLLVFLKWVASFAHSLDDTGSKMDLPNLATVIGPSILFSPGRDPAFESSFGVIRVVTELLENQDEFFTVPEDFLALIHDQEYFAHSMELPSKDFMKKCEVFMRQRSSGRAAGPLMSPVSGSSPFSSNNVNLAHLNRSGDLLDSRWATHRNFDATFITDVFGHCAAQVRRRPEIMTGLGTCQQHSPRTTSATASNHGSSPPSPARPTPHPHIRLQARPRRPSLRAQ